MGFSSSQLWLWKLINLSACKNRTGIVAVSTLTMTSELLILSCLLVAFVEGELVHAVIKSQSVKKSFTQVPQLGLWT